MLRPDVAGAQQQFHRLRQRDAGAKHSSIPAVRDDPTVYPPDELRERFYTLSPPDRAYERKRTRAWTRVKTGQ